MFLWYKCYLNTSSKFLHLITLSWQSNCTKELKTWLFMFFKTFFQPSTPWRLSEAIFVPMVWMLSNYKFEYLKLKTCSLFHQNLIYIKLKTCIFMFLNTFYSLWHHGGCRRPFLFLWYKCYIIMSSRFLNLFTLSWKSTWLKIKDMNIHVLKYFLQPLTS